MNVLRLFHVLFLFMWIGSLLTTTRFLGYLIKEDKHTQTRLALICRRIYFFVELPSMTLSVALGIILIFYVQFGASLGWFHMKLTFAAALVICDIITGKMISNVAKHGIGSGKLKYKVLHSVTALMLVGTLCSIYLVRNKPAEIQARVIKEYNITPMPAD